MGGGKDKYNLSNDHWYEVSRERQRVRQTFGNLVVQHAYPAMKLQLPFVSPLLPSSSLPIYFTDVHATWVVQNTSHKTRGSRLPPPCPSNPRQHRIPVHACPKPQKEERQIWQACRTRYFEEDGGFDVEGQFGVCFVGVFGASELLI